MTIILHVAAEPDSSTLTQACILCGEILSDYRNADWWPVDGPVIVTEARGFRGMSAGVDADAVPCLEVVR
jgi:hypothetical protein